MSALTTPREMRRIALVALSAALVIFSPFQAMSQAQTTFLTYTSDEYKTTFVSSNLTAVLTNDWPRVAFYHTRDRFSSIFEIGMPVIYLFNDTNGDGIFVRSEATHYANLDEGHASWNISAVRSGTDASSGQYVVMSRQANLSLYDSRVGEIPRIVNWARANFSFRITEYPTTFQNDLGNYMVEGKIAIQIVVRIEVLNPVNSSGFVLEQSIKGGMTANTFLLTEDLGLGYIVQTRTLGRVDETVNGTAFAHALHCTSLPTQSVEIAKEDGTVQAYYKPSSLPVFSDSLGTWMPRMNCSYYTTGSGLMLHTAYIVPNANGSLAHDMSLGLDEKGFYTGVRDWFKENLPVVLIVTGTIVGLISVALLIVMFRKSRRVGVSPGDNLIESRDREPPQN